MGRARPAEARISGRLHAAGRLTSRTRWRWIPAPFRRRQTLSHHREDRRHDGTPHLTRPEYAALAAVAADWMERVWRRRDLAAIGELHAPEFMDRSPAGRDPGPPPTRRAWPSCSPRSPISRRSPTTWWWTPPPPRWPSAGPRPAPTAAISSARRLRAPDHLPRHRDHPHRRRADHRTLGRVGRPRPAGPARRRRRIRPRRVRMTTSRRQLLLNLIVLASPWRPPPRALQSLAGRRARPA